MRKPYPSSSRSFFFLFYYILLAASTLFAFAVGCPAHDSTSTSTSTDTCPVALFDIYNSNSLEYMYYYRAAASSIASRASIPVSRSSIFRHTMSSSFTSPSSTSPPKPDETQQQENNPSSTERLALPEFPSADSGAQKLDVSGGQGSTVSLDHLGPIVVNTDGSMSRISNWEQMTEMEKKNTLRIVGKRNQQRLQALRAAGVEGST